MIGNEANDGIQELNRIETTNRQNYDFQAKCQVIGFREEVQDICNYIENKPVSTEIILPHESFAQKSTRERTPLILCVKLDPQVPVWWQPSSILPDNFMTIENLTEKYSHLRNTQGFNDYFLLASLAGRKVVVLYFDWERDEKTQRNTNFVDYYDEHNNKVAILHNNERILSSYRETRRYLSKYGIPLPLFLSWSASGGLTVQQQLALQHLFATAPDKTIDVDLDMFYGTSNPGNTQNRWESICGMVQPHRKKQVYFATLVFLIIVVFIVLFYPSTTDTVSPTTSPTLLSTGVSNPSPTISPTPLSTGIPSPTPSISPTLSPTISPTLSPTISPTLSPTISPTPSPTISLTPSPTHSPTTLG